MALKNIFVLIIVVAQYFHVNGKSSNEIHDTLKYYGITSVKINNVSSNIQVVRTNNNYVEIYIMNEDSSSNISIIQQDKKLILEQKVDNNIVTEQGTMIDNHGNVAVIIIENEELKFQRQIKVFIPQLCGLEIINSHISFIKLK